MPYPLFSGVASKILLPRGPAVGHLSPVGRFCLSGFPESRFFDFRTHFDKFFLFSGVANAA